jgi:hypothetical protein
MVPLDRLNGSGPVRVVSWNASYIRCGSLMRGIDSESANPSLFA